MSQIGLTSPLVRAREDRAIDEPVCCASLDGSIPWARLAIGIFVACQSMLLGLAVNLTSPDNRTTRLLVQGGMFAATLVVLAVLGWPIARNALVALWRRRASIEQLFLAGIAAAMGISLRSLWHDSGPVYFEVVSVLLVVYSAGQAISTLTRTRALREAAALTSGVNRARVVDGSAVIERAVDDIRLGDVVRVYPGEVVPVDGTVVAGKSLVRSSQFTGEWQSRVASGGSVVLAGTGCEDGTIDVRATSAGDARQIDELSRLIVAAGTCPTPLTRQADRFVRWFLPIVATVAGATLVYWWNLATFEVALFNALAVVLVACPCAAGLAAPIALWSCMSRLASRGLRVRGGDVIERLAEVRQVVFDKTGTLCDEQLELVNCEFSVEGDQRLQLMRAVASIESHSTHPVARALSGLCGSADMRVVHLRVIPGLGIEADTEIGRVRIIRDERVDDMLVLRVELNGVEAARFRLRERLRPTARACVDALGKMGLAVSLMTGDGSASAAEQLGVSGCSGLTPAGKWERVAGAREASLLFVGDGVNDAPAMSAAHVGIAMSSGAPVTTECAGAVLTGGDLSVIPNAINEARSCVRTIRSGLVLAAVYNMVGMTLAATGWLHPVLAAVLMSVSSISVGLRASHGSTGLSRSRWIWIAHFVGVVGQLLVLALLLDLGGLTVAAVFALSIALGLWVAQVAPRLAAWCDHWMAMLTVGGLGMTLGWWIDMGFASPLLDGVARPCCAVASRLMGADGPHSAWMYALMILFGLPAMYLMRRSQVAFSWKRWCCVAPIALGVPGMCLGMFVGELGALRLGLSSGQLQILVEYLFMSLGMCGGMMVAHVGSFHANEWRTAEAGLSVQHSTGDMNSTANSGPAN